jgi:putative SOS response-associated peptidase YedK
MIPMCGRFYLDVQQEELADYFAVKTAPQVKPRYNIAPSQPILAIVAGDTEREVRLFHWGLIPFWAKDEKIGYRTINARSETVEIKPAFRAAFTHRRCLIPASGFYEWKAASSGKQPYCIRPEAAPLFAFAGLYEHWQSARGDRVIDSCTIIVTEADQALRPIHDRMPVILQPEQFSDWLNPDEREVAKLKALISNPPHPAMEAYPVSKSVGDPRFDDVSCIHPLTK